MKNKLEYKKPNTDHVCFHCVCTFNLAFSGFASRIEGAHPLPVYHPGTHWLQDGSMVSGEAWAGFASQQSACSCPRLLQVRLECRSFKVPCNWSWPFICKWNICTNRQGNQGCWLSTYQESWSDWHLPWWKRQVNHNTNHFLTSWKDSHKRRSYGCCKFYYWCTRQRRHHT